MNSSVLDLHESLYLNKPHLGHPLLLPIRLLSDIPTTGDLINALICGDIEL